MNNDVVTLPQPASQGTVVEQSRAVAEVAAAVSVARQFPRDTNRAVEQMTELCRRLAIAQRAFYSVPNRGSGLSVHIARELARIWQNVDYGVRELSRDDGAGVSEMQAWSWDVQENVRSTRSFIVPHARMKKGKREALTELNDVYLNNQNAGARAVRECIFSMLPGWFLTDAERILRATLEHGDGKPIEVRRDEAAQAFAALSVPVRRLEARLEKPKGQWSPADVADLSRVYSSITQDGIPAVEFFPDEAVQISDMASGDPLQRTPEEIAEDAGGVGR